MSIKSKSPKLFIEPIPKTCHFSNIRSTVKTKEWDKIRFLSYDKAGHKCEICNKTGIKQGFAHDVECHEIWEYDDVNHIQKLIGLVSLCVLCHKVKHFGMAKKMGYEQICLEHIAKVNKWSKEEINLHMIEVNEINNERSKFEWTLDLTLLMDELYNLKINLNAKRKFAINKYKKKRKRKPKKIINKRPAKKKI
jgi:hypothetical protein